MSSSSARLTRSRYASMGSAIMDRVALEPEARAKDDPPRTGRRCRLAEEWRRQAPADPLRIDRVQEVRGASEDLEPDDRVLRVGHRRRVVGRVLAKPPAP